MSQPNDILAAVGAAPALPGAKCRGRHSLYDPAALGENPDTVAARHALAVELCSYCPALTRCESWFYSLPPRQRPCGVVAGVVREAKA
jgi:hypothetical protein